MRCTLFVAFLLAACGTHTQTFHDTDDFASSSDAATDLAQTQPSPSDMAIGTMPPQSGYSGPVDVGSSITLSATGTAQDGGAPLVTTAQMTGSVGTLDFEGTTYPAIAYEHIAYGSYDLAALLATTAHGLVVSYVYCESGKVTYLYTESLVNAPTPDPATGTCSFADGNTPIEAMFDVPATLDYGAPADIADVTGSELNIHGGTGTVSISGQTYDVDVFTTVDCTSCGSGGWHELHATIRSGTTLAFGIFYLQNNSTSTVELAYGFRFDVPQLWPPTTSFNAAWTLK